jgi:lysophospholipase L1-like esterase
MKRVWIYFIIIVVLILLVIVNQLLTISSSVRKAARFIETTENFQRHDSGAKKKILVIGDSTAVGIGSSDSKYSIAGRFGEEYKDYHIETIATRGYKLHQFIPFPRTINKKYDLILIQLGANDILRRTSYNEVEAQLETILKEAHKRSDNVVILHSGNIGLSPMFKFPFDHYITHRTRKVRDIYLELCKKTDTVYVDLFREKDKDLFSTDVKKYYAPDRLHLTDEGYGFWYSEVRKAMKKNDIQLE